MYGNDGHVTLRLRFTPPVEDGSQGGYGYGTAVPLEWAAQTLQAFNEVVDHCVAVTYSDELDAAEVAMPERASMPKATFSSGSLVIELVTAEPTLWGANALGLVALLLKQGPELAGLPHRIRERWYADAAGAEMARQALEVLKSARPAPELDVPSPSPYGLPPYGQPSQPSQPSQPTAVGEPESGLNED